MLRMSRGRAPSGPGISVLNCTFECEDCGHHGNLLLRSKSLKIILFRGTLNAQRAGGRNDYSVDHHNWVVEGFIAMFFHSGNKYERKGFILTTLLGIVGAFVATYLGQAVGWYRAGEGAGFIGAIVGAIIVLVVWGLIAPRLELT